MPQFEKQKNYYSFNIPVILRGAVRRSRRIHDRAMNPRPPGEGGPSQMVDEGLESVFSTAPLIRPDGHLLPWGEGFSPLCLALDSATSGRDALRAE